ncbi:MAG: hypothetical protein AAFO80_14960 [Pseudomonadota bacterium]
MYRLIPTLALTLLAACGDPPDLDAAFTTAPPAGDWPQIEPLGALLAQTDAKGHGADDTEATEALTARADALRGQAAR